jgi:excisionase family DNA binding protein
MTAGYAALVSDDEISTPEAAELLGVSLDTVRAMIREEKLPARRLRPGGPYVLARGAVEQARTDRAAGLRAGPVRLSEADRAKLREVRTAEAEADEALQRAYAARAALVAALGRDQRGTGAMAAALDVDRSTVQAILRDAEVPVVHHRQHTELTDAEVAALQRAQELIAVAKAGVDQAHDAREKLTRRLLERGGYGVATEVAHLLGRHRSRLLSGRGKRRRQG